MYETRNRVFYEDEISFETLKLNSVLRKMYAWKSGTAISTGKTPEKKLKKKHLEQEIKNKMQKTRKTMESDAIKEMLFYSN